MERIWESWERVLYAMTALRPSPDQVWAMRASVGRLLVALQRGLPDTCWSGYYFHTLLHAADYMDHYGGLGVFANQGAEAKHREGALAYVKGGSGGLRGRQAQAAVRKPGAQAGAGAAHISLNILQRGIKVEDLDECPVEDRGMFRRIVAQGQDGPVACPELSASQNRDIHTVWESLLLLNYLRTHPYCKQHDCVGCPCGGGTYVDDEKRRRSSVGRRLPKLLVTEMRAEWRAMLSLKENKFDSSPSSDAADRMDRHAAREVGRMDRVRAHLPAADSERPSESPEPGLEDSEDGPGPPATTSQPAAVGPEGHRLQQQASRSQSRGANSSTRARRLDLFKE
jgi:hypothetical protein